MAVTRVAVIVLVLAGALCLGLWRTGRGMVPPPATLEPVAGSDGLPALFADYRSSHPEAVLVETRWPDGGRRECSHRLEPETRNVPVGPFVAWHGNGVKAAEGLYDEDGMKTGHWRWWHDNGQLAEDGFFHWDEPVADRPYGRWDEAGQDLVAPAAAEPGDAPL